MRVSVTDIEQWRYWRESEDMELSELLKRLRRQSDPTEAMAVGSALHRALEISTEGEAGVLECDGYRFVFECDCEVRVPAAREVKVERKLTVCGVPVTLVAKVDTWQGLEVHDYKVTSRADFERFMSGFQWRYYLWMFHAIKFVWKVFEVAQDPREPMTYRVRDYQELAQWAYPAMEDDCMRELTAFVRFALDNQAYELEAIAA